MNMNASHGMIDPAAAGWNRTGETAGVDPATLNAWIGDGDIFLVDVREPHEFDEERIAGSFLVSMSRFDVDTFPRIPGLKTVLVSEAGPRSVALAERLHDAGFSDIYALEGGISGWKAAGLETDE